MVPLSVTYRRLLRKYAHKATCKSLSQFESLLAFHAHRKNEIDLNPDLTLDERENEYNCLKKIGDEAKMVIEPFKKEFKLVSNLWNARREFAMVQGNFHQIPTTWKDLGRFISKLTKYFGIKSYTIPWLWLLKVSYFFNKLWFKKNRNFNEIF